MSLRDFQRALCDLIASPPLCLALRDNPDLVLGRYDLSPRERSRLDHVVWQRGMSTTCSLYRSNRVTPIYTLLRYTCLLLGEALTRELNVYWMSHQFTDLQFGPEIERFGTFLAARIDAGEIDDPVLPQVLAFELAVNALHFSARRQILRELAVAAPSNGHCTWRFHPLARVVRFRHDPSDLLQRLAREEPPPYHLREGEFFVLLTVINGPLEVGRIAAEVGQRLLGLESGTWEPACLDEVKELVEANLIICGSETDGSAPEVGTRTN